MAVTKKDAEAWRIEIVVIWASLIFEPRCEKTNVLVSDLVQHKPGCATT